MTAMMMMMIVKDSSPMLLPLLLVAVRVASIAVSTTMFVPDEYFQCTEVAHRIVFGCAAHRRVAAHAAHAAR